MTNKHTSLGNELIEAMNEVLTHKSGKVSLSSREVKIPNIIDVKNIRIKFGFSQNQFAKHFGFTLSSIKDWEQGRRQPERSARILLTIIDKEPAVVERILHDYR